MFLYGLHVRLYVCIYIYIYICQDGGAVGFVEFTKLLSPAFRGSAGMINSGTNGFINKENLMLYKSGNNWMHCRRS